MNERGGPAAQTAGWAAGWPRSSRRAPTTASTSAHAHGTPGRSASRPSRGAPLRDGSPLAAELREIAIDAIVPNPQQPRTQFDDEALGELEHSIREFGLLQPIVVRETAAGRFQLVMGERRWRAAQRAGLRTVPAIVRQTADDAMLRDALLENIHRVQLNPLEEAAAYEQLLDEFGVTHEELADRLGRSRPVVTNTIRLLSLPVRCSGGWPPVCSPPGTRGRCSAWTTPGRRRSWPPASSPRACRCAPRRRRWCSLRRETPPTSRAP